MSSLEDTVDFPAPVMDIRATAQAIVEAMKSRSGNEGRHQEIIAQALEGAERRVQELVLSDLAKTLKIQPVYQPE